MGTRRSKPLLIAPLIPLWAIGGIFAAETMRGSRYLPAFVIVWSVLGVVFFGYILRQVLAARRRRISR